MGKLRLDITGLRHINKGGDKVNLCPLKFNNKNINADNITDNVEYKCEEENCAWWDTDTEECVVHNLGAIAEVLWNG